ncbi:hypothetical protein [Mesorhizobium tamadayense]|nr:hypothetical protein [Mesorhizobium tamadayense]
MTMIGIIEPLLETRNCITAPATPAGLNFGLNIWSLRNRGSEPIYHPG